MCWLAQGWVFVEATCSRESSVENLTLSFVLWFLALSFRSISPGLENLTRVSTKRRLKSRSCKESLLALKFLQSSLESATSVQTCPRWKPPPHLETSQMFAEEGQSSRVHYFFSCQQEACSGQPENLAPTDERARECWSTRGQISSKIS